MTCLSATKALNYTAVLVACVVLGSCTDDHLSPTAPLRSGAGSKNSSTALSLDQTIDDLIQQVLPRGESNAAAVRWGSVKRKLAGGQPDVGRKMFEELATWILEKTRDLTPPVGETQGHVAARLVLYMSIVTYGDPAQPLPPVPQIGADATVAIISPTAAAIVVTPANKAGIALPAGAVSQTTILAVYDDVLQVRAPCAGPLDTELCQYPRFYHFDAFPHRRLNVAARVAVCHVTSGSQSPPRDEMHDSRLRVAHDRPTDAVDYTPNATQTDGIEILPLTSVGDFLLCGNTGLGSAEKMPFDHPLLNRGWQWLSRAAVAAGAWITPKHLYAIDVGGGGLLVDFSTFAVVDPMPRYARYCPTQTHRTASYADLDSAIAHAPESNIVLVCDGNWPTNDANINKPVTIRSEHTGGATLSQPATAAANDAVLRVSGVQAGAVRIADLHLHFTGYGILALGTYDQVTVDSVSFTGAGATVTASANTGLELEASSVPSAHVTLVRSSFTQSYFGAVQNQPVAFNTYDSHFAEIGKGGVVLFSTPSTIEGHSVAGSVMEKADVVGNVFLNVGMGNWGPIMIESAGDNLIQNNQMSSTGSTNAIEAIWIGRPGVIAANTRPVRVRDNVISGHAPAGDSALPPNWGFRAGVRVVGGIPGLADSIINNSISGAFFGLDVFAPAELAATGNTFTDNYIGVRKNGTGAVAINRNDFTAYKLPMVASGTTAFSGIPQFANGAIACNWWGNANGPHPISTAVNPGGYLPYATQPIARTAVACVSNSAAPSVVRVCTTAASSGPPTVPTLEQAMQYVAPGGTVKICDGTYTAYNVSLNAKAMTIEGEGPGIPTLDAAGNGSVFYMNSPIPIATSVILRRLRLQNATSNDIGVGGNYGSILVDHVEFHPSHGTPTGTSTYAYNAGVGVFSATGAGVTVQNSTFDGGDFGISMNNATNVVVVNNGFANQLNSSINGGGGGSLVASNNTIANCGPGWCISVFNFGHTGSFTITNNTLNLDALHPVQNAINVHHATADISGNLITGTGGSRSPTDSKTWPMSNAILVSDSSTATVNGNRITGAYTGLSMINGTSGSGSDNVVSVVARGLSLYNAGNVSVSRSDFTSYETALTGSTVSAALARCNWWGSTDGPSNPQVGGNSRAYTPWAFAPIANSGASCDPNAPAPTTVRVCSTGGSYPTVSSLPSAMALVADGGTVNMCDGTYTVANVTLNSKSMTIQGEGPGLPTLDAEGQGNVFVMSSPTPISTAVTLRKLRLQHAAYNDVNVSRYYGSLLVDQVEFHPMHGVVTAPNTLAYSAGMGVSDATGAGVTVQNSKFDGGDIGVATGNTTNLVLTGNTFTNHLNAAIHAGHGGEVTASRNTITNCGPKWCIGIFNAATQTGTFKFDNNIITTDYAHPVINGIQADGATYVMDGNVITGMGGTRVSGDASTWPIQNSGIAVGFGAVAQLVRNVIAGSYNGVGLHTVSGTAINNTIHDIGSVMNLYNAAFSVTRNDFYNYGRPFQSVGGTLGSAATCNWWGSAAGPTGVPATINYIPWSTTPIAGQQSVVCQ